MNYPSKLGSVSHTSRGNLSPENDKSTQKRSTKGGNRKVNRELRLSSKKLGRLKEPSLYERESTNDVAKTYINSRKKKRRKYSSPVHSGLRHRSRSSHRKRRRDLQKRKSAVSNEGRFNEKRLSKRRRSLQHESKFLISNKHLPLRLGGEQVLLRFKRKSLLEDDGDIPSNDKKKRKGKKRRQAFRQGQVKARSVPLKGIIKGDFLKDTDRKAPGLTRYPFRNTLVNRNFIPQTTYDPVTYGAKTSLLSNPFKLSSIANEYNAINNRRQSVSNINKALYAPVSSVSFVPKSNQAMSVKSETRTPELASVWNTKFQNGAISEQKKIQHPVRFQYGNGQQQRNGLRNIGDQSKKQFLPNTNRLLYGYGHQSSYQPQFIKSQIALAGGSPRNTPFPQTGQRKPLFSAQERARVNPQWSLAPPTMNINNLVNVENDLIQRSRISQGLIMYLNLEDVQSGRATYASLKGDVTGPDKRTEITKFFGSCGKVARLNKGSEILLNGRQLKVTYILW